MIERQRGSRFYRFNRFDGVARCIKIGKRRGVLEYRVFSYRQPPSRETLIHSLSDFTLEFLCIARNNLTRIASYLRKAMTKLCIKILVKADSAIESAFPYGKVPRRGG